MGWFQEQRERSDRIGYVLSRYSMSAGRSVRVGPKVYHSLEEACAAAGRPDKGGQMIFVGMADKYGVAPEDTASARQPAVKQNPKHREAAAPSQVQA